MRHNINPTPEALAEIEAMLDSDDFGEATPAELRRVLLALREPKDIFLPLGATNRVGVLRFKLGKAIDRMEGGNPCVGFEWRDIGPGLSARNDVASDSVELYLHGKIGGDENVLADDFARALQGVPENKRVVVSINSTGGDVAAGTTIFNLLRARGPNVTTRVDGMAASMAATVFQAGAVRQMQVGTKLVLHNPHNTLTGDFIDMAKNSQFLRQVKEGLLDILCARTGQSRHIVSEMMNAVTVLDPREALATGFADEVLAGPSRAKNTMDATSLSAVVAELRANNQM